MCLLFNLLVNEFISLLSGNVNNNKNNNIMFDIIEIIVIEIFRYSYPQDQVCCKSMCKLMSA